MLFSLHPFSACMAQIAVMNFLYYKMQMIIRLWQCRKAKHTVRDAVSNYITCDALCIANIKPRIHAPNANATYSI